MEYQPTFVQIATRHGLRHINLNAITHTLPSERERNGETEATLLLFFAGTENYGIELCGAQAEAFQDVLTAHTVASIPRTASQTTPRVSASRLAYCETPGANRRDYLNAQAGMFAACRDADLDIENRDAMIASIAALLQIEITSRTQLTPAEMRIVKRRAETGYWAPGWFVNRGARLQAA